MTNSKWMAVWVMLAGWLVGSWLVLAIMVAVLMFIPTLASDISRAKYLPGMRHRRAWSRQERRQRVGHG